MESQMDHRERYALEKFGVAVESMATSAQSIQERLFNAYMSFHSIQEKDFQDSEDAELYRRIHHNLTTVRDGPEQRGYVQNTLDQMSDETAEEVAQDIVRLAGRLERKARGL
jgi:hypothetical protein